MEEALTLTVRYYIAGTNTPIAAPYRAELLPGSSYTVTSPTIEHYTLADPDQATVSGTLREDTVVTVYYRFAEQTAQYTVNYIGRVADKTQETVLATVTGTAPIDQTVKIEDKVFAGYTREATVLTLVNTPPNSARKHGKAALHQQGGLVLRAAGHSARPGGAYCCKNPKGRPPMKITFYGTRSYDRLYFEPLAADPAYGCTIRFLAANLDADTAPLAAGGEAVCAFVNADASAPVLRALAAAGVRLLLLRCAGFNQVDLAAAAQCGITVLRVPGYSPQAVAEHAMALAQAANRRICKAYIKVRNNNFALDGLLGHNLYGACAGIVGTGRIGAAMARICRGYGMTVLACDAYRDPALADTVRYVALPELLRAADLVSLHCPLTAETHHLLNAGTLALMRDDAILVNTSRGALIDTGALIDALRARRFAGVGLDVYEDEDGQVFEDFSDDVLQNEVVPVLLSFPNVVVTSHQAFFTRTALQSIAITTMENARAFARGEPLANEVKA